ncbi:MAG: trypsin-like peptidase domain-containing protein [Bacillota bacterium]
MKLSFLVAMLFSAQAFAFGLPTQQNFNGIQLPANFTANYDFEGIVALSNCSGSIVKFEGMTDDSLAYVMTNGHCVESGLIPPGKVIYKAYSNRGFTVLAPDSSRVGTIYAKELVYGTMTNTDVALYRVSETYAQIYQKYQTRPLMMDSQKPNIGENIEVISGYWKRGYSCNIDTYIPELREDNWTFRDSIRYTANGCKTIGGTSGSPITRAGTKTVIGINNTGNESGRKCTMNNPCEVDENGNVTVIRGASYGQQTYNIYTCLTTTNDIDLKKEGCTLPK